VAGGTRTAGRRHAAAAAATVGSSSSEGLLAEYGSAALEAALRGGRGNGNGSVCNGASAGGLVRCAASTVFGRSLECTGFGKGGVLFICTTALWRRSLWRVLAVALAAAGVARAAARARGARYSPAPSSWPSRRARSAFVGAARGRQTSDTRTGPSCCSCFSPGCPGGHDSRAAACGDPALGMVAEGHP
jgi:hypothetical protein